MLFLDDFKFQPGAHMSECKDECTGVECCHIFWQVSFPYKGYLDVNVVESTEKDNG